MIIEGILKTRLRARDKKTTFQKNLEKLKSEGFFGTISIIFKFEVFLQNESKGNIRLK